MRQDTATVPGAGRAPARYRRRWLGLVGLLAALFAAAWLLTLPKPPAPAPSAGSTGSGSGLLDRWPSARVVQMSGLLGDGRAYRPLFYPEVDVSVGTALTPDGATLRLLVRRATGDPSELMRLPAAGNPDIRAVTAAGDDLVWMVAPDGSATPPVLYHANWRTPAPATALAADTGHPVVTGSFYDTVIAGGRVYWAATAGRNTEIRSVALTGGAVTVRPVDGAYALSGWPWLSSAVTAVSGSIEMRNLDTGQRIPVPRTPPEVITCGPAWCRVLTPGPDGKVARTELMHPDGSARIRVAAGAVSSAVTDVALVDRFEILTSTIPDSEPDNLKLVLYDVTANRSSLLVAAAATVNGRGPVVWWSTGDGESVTWYALDLRTLR